MSDRPDYGKVAARLYQGGKVDEYGRYDDFTMVVLCAAEYQPRMLQFRGKVIHAGFNDTPWPTSRDLEQAKAAASRVADELGRGGRALVTCWAGLNRSGLVTGLALCLATALSSDQILRMIRAARGDQALSNQAFAALVRRGQEQAAKVRGAA